MSLKLLLVDDSPAVLGSLATTLDAQHSLTVVATATSGKRALRLLELVAIDVALLDMNMPRMNGLETLSLIRRSHPEVAVLVLTNHADMTWVVPALRAGADGYALKTVSTPELVRAIDAAYRRERPITSRLVDALVGTHSLPSRDLVHLSPRENEALALLARGLTTQQIGAAQHLSPSAVKKTVASLRAKLGSKTRAEAVAEGVRRGLVTPEST